jgi:carbon-monoxide dehydrogenase medium subunit
VKPAPFEYHRPSTVAETVELLADLPDAELMAGNQSLAIVMSNRLATPEHVVDINGVDELSYVEADDEGVDVGALVRHRELEASDLLAERVPMLPAAAEQIAGPVVRNRGTFGGSVGEADPAGNYPCVLVALDGEIELASVDGRRSVPARDYFIAYMMTEREEEELIVGARLPTTAFPPARSGMTFVERKRAAQTWPTLSVGCAVRLDDPGAAAPTIEVARFGLANAADVPLRIEALEREAEGEPLSAGLVETLGEIAYEEVRPQPEMHADETYKRELAREYVRRALREAHDRATAAEAPPA